jgi:hypothetical protein
MGDGRGTRKNKREMLRMARAFEGSGGGGKDGAGGRGREENMVQAERKSWRNWRTGGEWYRESFTAPRQDA